MTLEKPACPNAKVPISRHDECRRITWLFKGDGKHVPLNFQHCSRYFSIHVVHLVHPVDFLLNFFNHNNRFLLEGELFLKEDLPTSIYFPPLPTHSSGKPQKGKSPPSFTKFSLKVPRFFLILSQPSKNPTPSLVS